MCDVAERLEQKGISIGEERLAALLNKLFTAGRDEDAKKAIGDPKFRNRLYKEFGIK